MILIARDGTYGEYVESRREYDGENKSSSIASMGHDKSKNEEYNAQDSRYNSSELWAFAERSCHKKRPTRQKKSQEDVDNKDQTNVGERKYAIAPDDANNYPSWEVYDRNSQMPGASGISSVICQIQQRKIYLQYSGGVKKSHNFHMSC